jgi:hypothetical protein
MRCCSLNSLSSNFAVKREQNSDGGEEELLRPIKHRKALLEECDDPNCVSCCFCVCYY